MASRTGIRLIFCFNPRSREGSDEAKDQINAVLAVSIHAPVKGATPCTAGCCRSSAWFQSTLP